ncbi:unnamed protein product [Protopolystoma xenopodis]|uniref:Uncharacterized protein n=1 Tax=Protopolystoma xenopodis TaxID=117903 RepID=A0A3S5AYA3_9PLAT|nr:unnamed protein product [Protopolystoma xenopodis]
MCYVVLATRVRSWCGSAQLSFGHVGRREHDDDAVLCHIHFSRRWKAFIFHSGLVFGLWTAVIASPRPPRPPPQGHNRI